MDSNDFVKIAHRHLVFRDDWGTIESSYLRTEYRQCRWMSRDTLQKALDSFKDALDRTKVLALTSRPILIEGPQGSERQQFARAIVEFSRGDSSQLIAIDCRNDEKASILVADAERPDFDRVLFMDHFNDASDALQKRIAALMAAQSASGPRVILGTSGSLDVAWTRLDLHARKLVERGTVRRDIAACFSSSTIALPHLMERPWDIPPIVADCLQQSKVKYLTYNALHLLVRYPWSTDVEEIRGVLEAATTAVGDEHHLNFRILRRCMPKDIMYMPEKSGSQDLGFLETGADCHRRLLSHEWLKDGDLPGAWEMAGKVVSLEEAEAVRFDVTKMKRVFGRMGILPTAQEQEVGLPESYMVISRDYRHYTVFDAKHPKGKRYDAGRAVKQSAVIRVLVQNYLRTGDLGMDQRAILERAGLLDPNRATQTGIRQLFHNSRLWGKVIVSSPGSSFYRLV